MKTHEFAKALRLMAGVLEDGPDVQLNETYRLVSKSMNKPDPSQVVVNLHTLYALSKIDKNQWKALINDELNLQIID